jgi:hypothetical protein
MRFLLSFALDNGLMIGYPGQQSGTHCPAQEATWISLASWDLLGLPTKEVMAVTEKKNQGELLVCLCDFFSFKYVPCSSAPAGFR